MPDDYLPRAPLGQRLRTGLSQFARGAGQGLLENVRTGGLTTAYLMGRGEYGAAQSNEYLRQQQRAQEAEERRLAAIAERRAEAQRDLAERGIDPTTDEGFREAWSVFYRHGDYDAMDALVKMHQATRTEAEGGPASYTTAEGVFVRQPDGSYRNAGPPNNAPLVQIGDSGLKPEQAIAAEDRERARLDSVTKEYRDILDRHRRARAIYERIRSENRAPTTAETDTIIKLAARSENPEAVQEGDIYRKSGGPQNVGRKWLGLPPVLSRDQLEGVMGVFDTIAQDAEAQLGDLEQGARGTAAGRGLDPGAVVPTQTTPAAQRPPAGAKPHPTLPNVWVLPDGSGWTP